MSPLVICSLLPDVMGTYGDIGNVLVLQKRAQLQEIDTEIVTVTIQDKIPKFADIYVLGGAEDSAQIFALRFLQENAFLSIFDKNKSLLAICAGFQILSKKWTNLKGTVYEGLGLFDCITKPMAVRSTGECLSEPTSYAQTLGITQKITGFENHRGGTILSRTETPLGNVIRGVGNAVFDDDTTHIRGEGIITHNAIGSYLHGPLLVRNPQIADVILSRATHRQSTTVQTKLTKNIEKLRQQHIQRAEGRSTNPHKALLQK